MTTTDEKIQYINELKANIAMYDSLVLLKNTPEWGTLIENMYCNSTLKSNVFMLSQVSSVEGKARFVARIEAVAHFQQFLQDILLRGEQAKKDLETLVQEGNTNE